MTLTTAVTVVQEATARVEHTEEETESGKLWKHKQIILGIQRAETGDIGGEGKVASVSFL